MVHYRSVVITVLLFVFLQFSLHHHHVIQNFVISIDSTDVENSILSFENEEENRSIDDSSIFSTKTRLDGLGRKNQKNKDGIAMCLLIKDENEKLPEWLAYHYLKLPLQYLVVGVDSESTTSPKNILDKFRNETGMDIVVWNDAHFRLEIDTSSVDPIQQHRIRQRRFFSECMKHQKARGRKWLIMIDTDEFIANNVYGGHEPVLSDNQTLLDYINRKENEISMSTAIDSNNTSFVEEGCHLMPRLTFSAVDEKDVSTLHRGLPDQTGTQFNPMIFNTLRFFRHASPNAGKRNGYGKVIMNLQKINFDQMFHVKNVHRPVLDVCKHANIVFENKPLMVHHYIGSWEQCKCSSNFGNHTLFTLFYSQFYLHTSYLS